jgi:hypothetical protein
MRLSRWVPLAAALAAAGCSGDEEKSCTESGCASGLYCETVATGGAACFQPVSVTGHVYDLATSSGLASARVVGQDVNGAPVSPVAVSDADGHYAFATRAPRNADGSPASGTVTLRVDRAGYESFPSGLRTALPVALTGAAQVNGRWTVQSSLTDVGLRAIASPPAGEIRGTVQLPASGGGALVVAECGGFGYSAFPGTDGGYAIFNVPDGACEVAGYAKGVSYAPVAVTVAGATPVTANLVQSAAPTATVGGTVQFVSTTSWDRTSVLLVVDSTFDTERVRGLSPPGLKAAGVTNGGAWSISGIPDGHYRVLAAFETDFLVRDPSDIGGTAVLEFQVANGLPLLMDGATPAASLAGFKITGAVRLVAPIADATGTCTTFDAPYPLPAAIDPATLPVGECTTASATPSFAWQAYSSTDVYDVTGVDELGSVVWEAWVDKANTKVGVSYGDTEGTAGSPVVWTITPAQPLAADATYQVRVKALTIVPNTHTITRTLSASEDLLGVFTYVPAGG